MSKRTLKLFGLGTALVLALAAASLISGAESLAAQSCAVILSPDESIQQAIDAAPSGAVICLGEGTWEENLVIRKSLTIRGSGAGKTVIRSAMWDRPVVWIEGDEIEVNLDGVTITGASGDCSAPLERCPIGLVVEGSAQVVLTNSQVSDNDDFGLFVGDSAQVTLQNSEVSDNGGTGLGVWDSAQVNLQSSTVSSNGESGLSVEFSAQVSLQSSTVSSNGESGLSVGFSARVSLQSSQVSGNGLGGLNVGGSAQVNLQGSTVSDNVWWGLNVGGSAKVSLQGSTVSDNMWNGLGVGGSAQVNLQDSTVSDNGWRGLDVRDSARVSIEGSLIESNGTEYACEAWLCVGIGVRGEARVELTNTTIRNNTGWGIAACLRKCGNKYDDFEGTVLWEGRGNEIYDNGEGNVCLP